MQHTDKSMKCWPNELSGNTYRSNSKETGILLAMTSDSKSLCTIHENEQVEGVTSKDPYL